MIEFKQSGYSKYQRTEKEEAKKEEQEEVK